ncbi:MAG: type II secretion system major pseudopilin GspG [Candidatus Omnitrophica bacterium]|nr:type II secretion system major pseudopilin GspG [Candidatus Omnitrophota bacterium]
MFRRNKISLASQQAFTFVEIMIVVIIIAALSAMVVPRLAGRSERAKTSLAKADIETNLATALKMYELDNGFFPSSAQGLNALREKPSGSPEPRNWNGPYVEKEPLDPWGGEYEYTSPGKNNTDYDLYSRGKDLESNDDDIKNWE